MKMNKCNVCNKNDSIGVYSSSCGPVSFAYCKQCARKGAEPYGALVAYISGAVKEGKDAARDAKQISEGYQQVIDISLDVAGKTREEFYVSIDDVIKKENEYWENLEKIEAVREIDIFFPDERNEK
jgi:hypothetical protein